MKKVVIVLGLSVVLN